MSIVEGSARTQAAEVVWEAEVATLMGCPLGTVTLDR